jgi:plastocyanin
MPYLAGPSPDGILENPAASTPSLSLGRFMFRLRLNQRPVAMVVLGLLISSCGGDDGGTPPSTIAIAKTSTSGDAQTATVGQPLASPLQVVVTDGGTPSAGTTVTWAATDFEGQLVPTAAVTDANGVASSSWTLSTVSGPQTATATLSGANGSPVSFTATANPDVATTLTDAGGNGQVGNINSQLAQQLQAKVADQFGNGIAGVDVAWAASGGTTSAPTVPTNGSGISAVTVTLGGTPGPVTVTATSGSLTGSPLTFTATAQTPPPIPTTATVQVGNIFFESNHNSSQNPAVDTVAVGGTVTWNWVGGLHSVRSTGSLFTSSNTQSSGSYQFTFSAAGTYSYDCAVHGPLMTGRVVVR